MDGVLVGAVVDSGPTSGVGYTSNTHTLSDPSQGKLVEFVTGLHTQNW